MEADVDDWMTQCSLITVTEVRRDYKAGTLHEKGWNFYNAPLNNGADDCAVAWRKDTWRKYHGVYRKLNNKPFYELSGHPCAPVYACSVVLRRNSTGHRLLVSVAHLPAHVEGAYQWRTTAAHWQARKAAYLSSLTNWSTHIQQLERSQRPDATMIVADWNLNLKEHWVQNLLHDHFGKKYKLAWKRYPTDGSSLTRDDATYGTHPLGAPGISPHDRIIDGTLTRGLDVVREPNLMSRVSSSDHRPYKEGFEFAAVAGKPSSGYDPSGDTKPGDAWWGFGDTMVDEIYDVPHEATGAAGGELL
jgi:hypothetical protein